jgi:hypothetical protein
MKKVTSLIATATAAMLMLCGTPLAQTVPLSGTIVSKTIAFIPSSRNLYSAIVYLIPATGHFVLTQFCSNNIFPESVSATTFGFIASLPVTVTGSAEGCISFSPGYAVPSGALVCSSAGPNPVSPTISCSISGIVTK